MKLFVVFICCLLSSTLLAEKHYWVVFNDKPQAEEYLLNPELFLSPRSIERRLNQGIPITYNDVPVDFQYIESIQQLNGVTVRNTSKWFNAISVSISDDASFNLDVITQSSFVKAVLPIRKLELSNDPQIAHKNFEFQEVQNIQYGQSYDQIDLIKGLALHGEGFHGEGMLIAVIDGGFTGTDVLDGFAAIRDNNQIVDQWNFVEDNDSVYQYSSHGTMVLSTIAARVSGELYGTASEAQFALYVSEDVTSESLVEEDNWIRAIERADSLGVDICNTSLGYTTMDDPNESHAYEQLDGNTLSISIAADIAASKGILIINSAGNLGESSWFYIGAPADADSVLAIGACDVDGFSAPFSSHGPSADGDVKPNVTGPGWNVVVYSSNGLFTGSGTSFASPIITGMAACLWQKYPDKTSMEVFRAIEESAHLYDSPNADFGYGIPDFEKASTILQDEDLTSVEAEESEIKIIMDDEFTVILENQSFRGDVVVEITDDQGRVIASQEVNIQRNTILSLNLSAGQNLSSAIYLVRVYNKDLSISKKFIKW